MPLWVPPAFPQVVQTNLTAAARVGTLVTASATIHTKGAWASLLDPLDDAVYGLFLRFADVASAATVTSMLVDIGAGPTGGGSERVILPDLSAWGAVLAQYGGPLFSLPVYVPTGERLSARCQAAIASDTVRVAVWAYQDPLYPLIVARWKTYGAVLASSRGTPVTPGNGAFGAWTEIPAATTTTRDHFYWFATLDGLEDTTLSDEHYLLELGYGASAAQRSIGVFGISTDNLEEIQPHKPTTPIYRPVPSGTQLWARLAGGSTENRGVIIYAGD